MFTANRTFYWLPYQRCPQGCKIGHGKRRRHHADNRILPAVQFNVLADDAGVAAELSGPQPVRKHDFVFASSLIVARRDGAAEQRLHAEGGKEGRLYPCRLKHLWIAVTSEPERHEGVNGAVFEDRVLLLPIQVIRGR